MKSVVCQKKLNQGEKSVADVKIGDIIKQRLRLFRPK